MYKAFLARSGKFVAIKRINCFERVSRGNTNWDWEHESMCLHAQSTDAAEHRMTVHMCAQEKRHQMMNDIRALCNVTEPSLVQFIGAYHAPENGQVGCIHGCNGSAQSFDKSHSRNDFAEGILWSYQPYIAVWTYCHTITICNAQYYNHHENDLFLWRR